MFADSEAGQRISACLAHRGNGSTEVSQVADAMTSMFEDTYTALTPIIGRKGVAALHRRSLHLCISKHPLLGDGYKMLVVGMDLQAFKALLAQHSKADALLFSEENLKTFYQLLTALVGPPLAQRLLLDVWEHAGSGRPIRLAPVFAGAADDSR